MRRFLRGESVTGALGRTEVLREHLEHSPSEQIVLTRFGLLMQWNEDCRVEILMNGQTVHVETVQGGVDANSFTLPFLKMPSYGLLQVFMNNPFFLATAMAFTLEGFYENHISQT